MKRIGIDIGSTTAKLVAVGEDGGVLFSKYARHNAQARAVVIEMLGELRQRIGDEAVGVRVTGSVGMGVAERLGLPFVQEVVAASAAIAAEGVEPSSMIDIGGEDAKVVFFSGGEATDLRMNGNCAGGTGAFIDQMAAILGVGVDELSDMALRAERIYPIASRCGVFCKTDIQNLIAKNARREDIAASIFHAVAVQTVVTLAHGCEITPPVLFCGGPLTFIPALRKAFADYLKISESDIILPRHGTLLPALGSALHDAAEERTMTATELADALAHEPARAAGERQGLPPIFSGEEDYARWKERVEANRTPKACLRSGEQDAYIGIDSGSTTTKIVVTDTEARVLFSFYSGNVGNPIETVEKGLRKLQAECAAAGATLRVAGSCSTGYGEDLIKTAFQLDRGIVETMAHYIAASHLRSDVSFILDIGGQDMKAIFADNGVIDRVEINEACSSGCGSFIETFAKTLGYSASDFAAAACRSKAPCDLGTRCTVFMNSKVKQALREGATVDDIAAGLAYSVVKNCLYKVLKLKDLSALGKSVVVQGGTLRNDAIVRAFELLTGREVARCDAPELMGALGCALHARKLGGRRQTLDEMLATAAYTTSTLNCKGCDNQCLVARYRFGSGKSYYSGNRCERVFTNGDGAAERGGNAYRQKHQLLFDRPAADGRLTIGIPRSLNTFENYPFWHALLTASGMRVELSAPSKFANYEQCARMVMSDNICFPAKLVHSHIQDLIDKRVDRVLMPFVVYEKRENSNNSYNCPIVTGYSEVIKSVQSEAVPIDAPEVTFKDEKLLRKQCAAYLAGLGVPDRKAKAAVEKALAAQADFERRLVAANEATLAEARAARRLTVVLAGRPYHTDPLIQHKVSEMLTDMGISVITDDIVRGKDIPAPEAHFLKQWSYPNRILRAAQWCAEQGSDVQFVELTSFGCGPDAFLVDEVKDVLARHGKALTLLKLDDINNVGSMKLRVRSLVDSLRLAGGAERAEEPFRTVPAYDDEACRRRKILVPFFTPFLSPLIPAVMRTAGYDVETLPMSDTASCDLGLKYANNEVCYPATLIVGDIVKALQSGRYDPAQTVVAMTQTGGQCRASNYVALIKRALVNAGFGGVPVVSLTFGSVDEEQAGLKMDWKRLVPTAFRAIVFSDCISKFYYASVVREKKPGQAATLKDKYLDFAARAILAKRSDKLTKAIPLAAADFDAICLDKELPRVGVVGEIFLKFNPFAQKNVTDWLVGQGIEVQPPVLTDFFMQSFVNRKAKEAAFLERKSAGGFVYDFFYRIARRQFAKVNSLASRFRYFTPFADIFDEAREASAVISLNAQFGEGWLLPAEIMSYARNGVNNVVSLQPFGCIANHIVSKGVERRVKELCPEMNLLSLDFDSGVSDVNITNRMLLFINNLTKSECHEAK